MLLYTKCNRGIKKAKKKKFVYAASQAYGTPKNSNFRKDRIDLKHMH